MRFLLDENVPTSVATVLRDLGHRVERAIDVIPAGSPDPLLAAVSEEREAVLVSADNDFKSIGSRMRIGKGRFRRLSRIALKCSEYQAAQRLEKAMSLVEFEYRIAQESHDPRMIVIVAKSYIRTER